MDESRKYLATDKRSRRTESALFALSNGQYYKDETVLLGDPDDVDLRAVGFTSRERQVSYEGPETPDDV